MQLFISSFPILLLIAVWVYFMRQMQGGAGGRGAMSFGKSRARLLGEDQVQVTFADVAGVDEAKEEVVEIVEFLKDPGKFQRLGGKIPRGVLMVGSPGTGKTLLARAIAGEAKVPFFTISGSDFVEMFVGVGASRVRDMFDQAKKHAPVHHLHRRDRRGRPPSRRGPGRRSRRARADAQPAAGRDGRLRGHRRHHRHRGDQPSRRARSGAAAPGSFRPPGRRAAARRARPRADPQGAHAQAPARRRREAADHRTRHAGLLGRRSRQPRQRGGIVRRARQSPHGDDGRVRARQGQDHDGRGAPLDGHGRAGEAAHRLSRGRPCDRRPVRARARSGLQGDDHSARPRAGRDDVPAGGGPLQHQQAAPRKPHHHAVRRSHRRGD